MGTRAAEAGAVGLSAGGALMLDVGNSCDVADRQALEVRPVHARRSKRALDIVGALLALIVFSPLFLLTALAVLISDRGPIFFRQVRVGADGRHFQMVKFRSMRTDAERVLRSDRQLYERYLENDHKLGPHEDTRLTPIGRFIRATSLDELPQFWNVLKGDMSLVGPRPVLPQELDHRYGYRRMHYVAARPGLTGPWQVSGRSRVSYDTRVTLDATYIEQWNLGRDVQILLRTPRAVLARDGAH